MGRLIITALVALLMSAPTLAAPGIRAVLAGVGAYRPPINALNFTVADARLMEKAVGGSSDRVTVLTTGSAPDQLPTQANILRAVREQAARAQPDDTFIFYFSGHGVQSNGKSYAVPLDVDTSNIGTFLSISDLREMVKSVCKARTKIIILDCCHSGSTRALTPVPWAQVFAPVEGMVTIAASTVEAEALESRELGQGLLTYYLVRGMAGEAAENGVITLGRLKKYVVEKVNAQCAKMGKPHQNPQFILPPDAESAPLSQPNASLLASLPWPDAATLATRPRFTPGLLVTFASDDANKPDRAMSNAVESEMRRRFVGAGFPVVVASAAASEEARTLDFQTATSDRIGQAMTTLNSRFLVRGTISATEVQQGSELANLITVQLTLRVQLLDAEGRVLAEVTSDDAEGRPIAKAGGTRQSAQNKALTAASQRVFERMQANIAESLKKETAKPGS